MATQPNTRPGPADTQDTEAIEGTLRPKKTPDPAPGCRAG